MSLNVILVSIEFGHFVHVSNYVSKADQTPDVQDPVVLAGLKCAACLGYLESKKYKLAGQKVHLLSLCLFLILRIFSAIQRHHDKTNCW